MISTGSVFHETLPVETADYSVLSIVISEENWPGHSDSLGVGV